MSTSPRVEITQEEDGWFKAVDEDTGTEIRARSKIEALVAITSTLQALDDVHRTVEKARDVRDRLETMREADDTARELRELVEAMDEVIRTVDRIESGELLDRYEGISTSVQQRARDENVDEDVVSEAIEWARER